MKGDINTVKIGLVLLVLHSSLGMKAKKIASVLIGLGGLYPMSWFTMFILAPGIGRTAAHHHFLTEALTYIGVTGLLAGIVLLFVNLFFGLLREA